MRRTRDLFQWAARKLGAEIIPNWRASSFASEHLYIEHLKQVFAMCAVDSVFDVGASDGHFARILRRQVEFSGMIFSFEPQPESYQKLLVESGNDPNWQAFNYALGASNSTLKMNIMALPWFSSFLAPKAEMPDIMKNRNKVEDTCDVEVRRLEDVFVDLMSASDSKAPFLKMDTQGFDLEVLKGAGACISDIVGVQSEVSLIPIYEGMPDWQEALREYNRLGFELTGLFPVSRDETLRLVELDAVSVRAQTS